MSEFLEFRLNEESDGKATEVWDVVSKHHGDVLAQIRWYGAWRQYTVHARQATIWNQQCVRDLARFIQERMQERELRLRVKRRNGSG